MAEIYNSQHPDDLKAIALKLIEKHHDKRIFAFHGQMGAGKTTLIKSICDCLGVVDTVTSPTFAIINEYLCADTGYVYHFDLYRIKSWTEMLEIGYEDYFSSGNYCLMEWPEKIVNLLPEETVHITIEVSPETLIRTITF